MDAPPAGEDLQQARHRPASVIGGGHLSAFCDSRWSMHMADIFVSYRRGDSAGHTGRLVDSLVRHFGSEAVFQDVQSISVGSRWDDAIRDGVVQCRLLLAVIGRDWLVPRSDGRPRIDDLRTRSGRRSCRPGARHRGDSSAGGRCADARRDSATRRPETVCTVAGPRTVGLALGLRYRTAHADDRTGGRHRAGHPCNCQQWRSRQPETCDRRRCRPCCTLWRSVADVAGPTAPSRFRHPSRRRR